MKWISICPTFTFSHLADAFIQSDLHMCDLQCIHILEGMVMVALMNYLWFLIYMDQEMMQILVQ